MNGKDYILIVCLYVDDLIFTGNNVKMFDDFKKEMAKEFEMTNIGLMSYYLGIEVKYEKNFIDDIVRVTGENVGMQKKEKGKKKDICFSYRTCNSKGKSFSMDDAYKEFHFDYLIVGAGRVRLDGFLDGAVAVVEQDGGVAHKFCWTRRRAR
ncbi:hypothetical protein RJ639_001644 [Escallonia herrerae]|uniref:Reverse transcriptase Ty1/copia-type domain-containing protein n=1 Tax=Escallonia herrerae TaxID=1293975 RepID=A0AA88XBN1_9ASTE|nr:hypothetical protein RJ639_001644 [Escallonia herrerae]